MKNPALDHWRPADWAEYQRLETAAASLLANFRRLSEMERRAPDQLELILDGRAPAEIQAEGEKLAAKIVKRQSEIREEGSARYLAAIQEEPSPLARLEEDARKCLETIDAAELAAIRSAAHASPEIRAHLGAPGVEIYSDLAALDMAIQPQRDAARRLSLDLSGLDRLEADRLEALGRPRPEPGIRRTLTAKPLQGFLLGASRTAKRLKDGGIRIENPAPLPVPSPKARPNPEAWTALELKTRPRLSMDADKLLRMALADWTADQKSGVWRISLERFAELANFTAASQERKADRARAAAADLFAASWKYADKGGGEIGVHFCAVSGYARGRIFVRLTEEFARLLLGSSGRITWAAASLLSLQEEDRAAYFIGRKMEEYSNQDGNRLRGTADRLAVKTLLPGSGIVSFAELAKSGERRKWPIRIRRPLERALETLANPRKFKDRRPFLLSWSYCTSGGGDASAILSSPDLDFHDWARLLIRYELAEKPPKEDAERLERSRAEREARAKKAAEKRAAKIQAGEAPRRRGRPKGSRAKPQKAEILAELGLERNPRKAEPPKEERTLSKAETHAELERIRAGLRQKEEERKAEKWKAEKRAILDQKEELYKSSLPQYREMERAKAAALEAWGGRTLEAIPKEEADAGICAGKPRPWTAGAEKSLEAQREALEEWKAALLAADRPLPD